MVPKDITVTQGETFRLSWTQYHQAVDVDGNLLWDDVEETIPTLGDPYDFTGVTARAQARRTPASETAWLTATTAADDGIVLGAALGTVELTFTDEKSEALGAFTRDKDGGWDFKIYWPSGDEEFVVGGDCIIRPTYTKDATA